MAHPFTCVLQSETFGKLSKELSGKHSESTGNICGLAGASVSIKLFTFLAPLTGYNSEACQRTLIFCLVIALVRAWCCNSNCIQKEELSALPNLIILHQHPIFFILSLSKGKFLNYSIKQQYFSFTYYLKSKLNIGQSTSRCIKIQSFRFLSCNALSLCQDSSCSFCSLGPLIRA